MKTRILSFLLLTLVNACDERAKSVIPVELETENVIGKTVNTTEIVSYTVTTSVIEDYPYQPSTQDQFYPGTLNADELENHPFVYSYNVVETTSNGNTQVVITNPTPLSGAAADLFSGFDAKTITSDGTTMTATDFNGNSIPLYSNVAPFQPGSLNLSAKTIGKKEEIKGDRKDIFLQKAKKDFDKVTEISPNQYQLIKTIDGTRRELIYDMDQQGIVKSKVYKNGQLASDKERHFKKFGKKKMLIKSKVKTFRNFEDGKVAIKTVTEDISNIEIK